MVLLVYPLVADCSHRGAWRSYSLNLTSPDTQVCHSQSPKDNPIRVLVQHIDEPSGSRTEPSRTMAVAILPVFLAPWLSFIHIHSHPRATAVHVIVRNTCIMFRRRSSAMASGDFIVQIPAKPARAAQAVVGRRGAVMIATLLQQCRPTVTSPHDQDKLFEAG